MHTTILDNNHLISFNQHKSTNSLAPSVIFLHGLMSDKYGRKAEALKDFCIKQDYNFISFDNVGHGESTGEFRDCSIDTWFNCALDFIQKLACENVYLVGSSMGGWVSLLLALVPEAPIKGMVLIAPAPDFTRRIYSNFTDTQRVEYLTRGYTNIYADKDFAGIPISRNLIENSEKYTLMDKEQILLKVPVSIIQGMQDMEVPYESTLDLIEKISAPYLQLKLQKYSGHRLSEEHDMNVICNSLEELIKYGK